jgi:hypothetical protein
MRLLLPVTLVPCPALCLLSLRRSVHTKHVRTVAADGTETEADENPWQGMEFKDPYLQVRLGWHSCAA